MSDQTKRPPRCGALATDINTRERFHCTDPKGHKDTIHRWQRIEGDQLRSVSWIGDDVFVGTPKPSPAHPARQREKPA